MYYPGIETGLPRCEIGEEQPEIWQRKTIKTELKSRIYFRNTQGTMYAIGLFVGTRKIAMHVLKTSARYIWCCKRPRPLLFSTPDHGFLLRLTMSHLWWHYSPFC